MLPSISNLLNPLDSSRSDHQFDHTHQLPTLLPPHTHSARTLPFANPMRATPLHRQPELPGPAGIRNPIIATPSVHANQTVHPIAHYTGRPIPVDHNKFPVAFDDEPKTVYAENQEHPVQHSQSSQAAAQGTFDRPYNTSAVAMVNGSANLNNVSDPGNALSGNGDPSFIPSTLTTSSSIKRIAAIIRAQAVVHTVAANPELKEPPILTPQRRKRRSRASNRHFPSGIQQSREQPESFHQPQHSSYNDNENSSFKVSPYPETGNSSPGTSNTPHVQIQTDVLSTTPARVSSGERLFPSVEELEVRKLHFMRSTCAPSDPKVLPKKRSFPHALSSHRKNEEENTRLESNSEKELHFKRIKITRTSHLDTEVQVNASNCSPVHQDDSSPTFENFSSTDNQTHFFQLGFLGRSHGYNCGHEPHPRAHHSSPEEGRVGAESFQYSRRALLKIPSCGQSKRTGVATKSDDGHSSNTPAGQENLNASQNVAGSTKRRTDQKKKYTSVSLSTGGKYFNNLAPAQSSRNETGSDESRLKQAPTEVKHAVEEHVMGTGIVLNTYKCDECNATFANEDSITRHKRVQHIFATGPNQMVTCPECTLQLRNNQNLKRHLATHGPNAKHKCTKCDAKFVTERARTNHMRDVHGQKGEKRSVKDRSTTCPVTGCSYASNQTTNVKRHYDNKHLNIKRFHCTHPTCDYIGSTRANRQAHMETHEKS